MAHYKSFARKIVIGAFLIVVAALLTVLIKESLDTQDPESALPLISVVYDGGEVPHQTIYRAGYTWSFFTTIETWQAPSLAPEDLPIIPAEIAAGANMKIIFSSNPTQLRVWRAEGRYGTEFVEIAMPTEGEFIGPTNSGTYLYRILADWGTRGEIQYYFALSIA